jgi:hypothetical protein
MLSVEDILEKVKSHNVSISFHNGAEQTVIMKVTDYSTTPAKQGSQRLDIDRIQASTIVDKGSIISHHLNYMINSILSNRVFNKNQKTHDLPNKP